MNEDYDFDNPEVTDEETPDDDFDFSLIFGEDEPDFDESILDEPVGEWDDDEDEDEDDPSFGVPVSPKGPKGGKDGGASKKLPVKKKDLSCVGG